MVFCCRYIAELALTSKCSAASRRDPPASTNSITRILKSPGYGPRIGQTPPNQCARLAPPAHFGNPDSLRLERAASPSHLCSLSLPLLLATTAADSKKMLPMRVQCIGVLTKEENEFSLFPSRVTTRAMVLSTTS